LVLVKKSFGLFYCDSTLCAELTKTKVVWDGHLDKGVYLLVPSTTGCNFKKRNQQPSSDIHLTENVNEDEIILSKSYQNAISEIFHQLDLNDSQSLSRAEFNLYNWRTSGSELTVSKSFILQRCANFKRLKKQRSDIIVS
jgi:hypothetical protein